VSLDDKTFWHQSSATGEHDAPLDVSLVARYHELCILDADGNLSDEERAELCEVERLLDEQERTASSARVSESSLDQEIEKLKQLIELSRQVISLV